MSSTITATATKPKDPPPPPTDAPPTPAKKQAPAVDLSAQPSAPSSPDFTRFLEDRARPPVSAGCASAVNGGAEPGKVATACTVREFAATASAPSSALVPVETDAACVRAYEKEGAAWGEAVGEEAKDLIKKAPVPVVRHRVAKAVKDATTELAKDVAHTEAVSSCKVPTDAAQFAATHAPIEIANQSKAPPKPPAPPNALYTPADPPRAMSKVK